MSYESLYIKPPVINRAFDWKRHNPKTRKELDAFFSSAEVSAVKRQMVEMGRRLYQRGYVDGNGGNLSVRVATISSSARRRSARRASCPRPTSVSWT